MRRGAALAHTNTHQTPHTRHQTPHKFEHIWNAIELCSAKPGPIWLDLGQILAQFDKVWPVSTKFGPRSAMFGQMLAKSGRSRPKIIDFERIGQTSTKSGPRSTKFNRVRPSVGQMCPMSTSLGPEFDNSSASLWPKLGTSGRGSISGASRLPFCRSGPTSCRCSRNCLRNACRCSPASQETPRAALRSSKPPASAAALLGRLPGRHAVVDVKEIVPQPHRARGQPWGSPVPSLGRRGVSGLQAQLGQGRDESLKGWTSAHRPANLGWEALGANWTECGPMAAKRGRHDTATHLLTSASTALLPGGGTRGRGPTCGA